MGISDLIVWTANLIQSAPGMNHAARGSVETIRYPRRRRLPAPGGCLESRRGFRPPGDAPRNTNPPSRNLGESRPRPVIRSRSGMNYVALATTPPRPRLDRQDALCRGGSSLSRRPPRQWNASDQDSRPSLPPSLPGNEGRGCGGSAPMCRHGLNAQRKRRAGAATGCGGSARPPAPPTP